MMGAETNDARLRDRDFTYYLLRFVGAINVLALLWALTPWFPW